MVSKQTCVSYVGCNFFLAKGLILVKGAFWKVAVVRGVQVAMGVTLTPY